MKSFHRSAPSVWNSTS